MNLPRSMKMLLAAALVATAAERAMGQCGGQPCSGLWVGEATMQLVSDANPILPDLGFVGYAVLFFHDVIEVILYAGVQVFFHAGRFSF